MNSCLPWLSMHHSVSGQRVSEEKKAISHCIHTWCYNRSESAVNVVRQYASEQGMDGLMDEGEELGCKRWRNSPGVVEGSEDVRKFNKPGCDLPCWFSATTVTSYSVFQSRPLRRMCPLVLGTRTSSFQAKSSLYIKHNQWGNLQTQRSFR